MKFHFMKKFVMSYKNDNVILIKKMKQYDEEKDKIKKGEKELKVKISELNVENRNKEEKLSELNDILNKKNEENIEENQAKEIINLKKEIENLKSKCINHDKLVFSFQQKDTRKEDENEKSNNLKNNINITKKFVNKINIKENKSAFKPFKKKSINLKRNKSK